MNCQKVPRVIFYLSEDKVYAFFYCDQSQTYEINNFQGNKFGRCSNDPDELFSLVDYHFGCCTDAAEELSCLFILARPAGAGVLISENPDAVKSVACRLKDKMGIGKCEVVSSAADFLSFVAIMCRCFSLKQTVLDFNGELYITPSCFSDQDEQTELQLLRDFEYGSLPEGRKIISVDDNFIINLLGGCISGMNESAKSDPMLPDASSPGIRREQNLLQKLIEKYGKTDI